MLDLNGDLDYRFADESLSDAWRMSILREIDGELAGINLCEGGRPVDVEGQVFRFVVRDGNLHQLVAGFPTDLFYTQQRNLDINIFLMGLDERVRLGLAIEAGDRHGHDAVLSELILTILHFREIGRLDIIKGWL